MVLSITTEIMSCHQYFPANDGATMPSFDLLKYNPRDVFWHIKNQTCIKLDLYQVSPATVIRPCTVNTRSLLFGWKWVNLTEIESLAEKLNPNYINRIQATESALGNKSEQVRNKT